MADPWSVPLRLAQWSPSFKGVMVYGVASLCVEMMRKDAICSIQW